VYSRPLWLALFGPLRQRLSLEEVYKAYLQRFDQEHGQRLVKQKLLATAYQTPDVEHEQRWWNMVALAYFQLWLARGLAGVVLRPWEKYLPQWRNQGKSLHLSPGLIQRDFGRIIWQIGTPAHRLKPTQGKTPWEGPGGSFATPETASRGQERPLTARL